MTFASGALRRWWAAAIGAALVAAPSVAAACPYCAAQDDSGIGRGVVLAVMIATPFLAVAVAVPLIVRKVRKDELNHD